MLTFIPGLSQIQTFLLVIVIALATGFGGGYWTKSKFVQADQAAAAKQAIVETKESAKEARVVDQKVDAGVQKIEARTETLVKEMKNVRKPIVKRKPVVGTANVRIPAAASPAVPEAQVASTAVDCADPVLSVGSVRVLNDALAGKDADPAWYGDAESEAPTDVGLSEVSTQLIKVAAEYHELALRHDQLVDWVDKNVLQ